MAGYRSSHYSVQQIIPFEVSGCTNETFSEAKNFIYPALLHLSYNYILKHLHNFKPIFPSVMQ